ncbi:MAG TPA: hypothetical protein VFV38_14690 [Ktedonobacteraceae bacterium]|nr:hypothetical protein [Ktedonobacteraceae bacterium]
MPEVPRQQQAQQFSSEQSPRRTPTEAVKHFFNRWDTTIKGTIFTVATLANGIAMGRLLQSGDTTDAIISGVFAAVFTASSIKTAIDANRGLNNKQQTIQNLQGRNQPK